MIVIEIDSTATRTKSGNNAKGPWSMTFQQIAISGHMQDGFPAKHPRESTIQLEENAQPYPAGRYTLGAESFYFGDFDRFSLGRLKLVPLQVFFAELNKQLGVQVAYGQTAQPKAA
jgi:hypothetical protein